MKISEGVLLYSGYWKRLRTPIRKMHAAKLAKVKHVHGVRVVAYFTPGIGLGLVVIGGGVAGYVNTGGLDAILFLQCSAPAR